MGKRKRKKKRKYLSKANVRFLQEANDVRERIRRQDPEAWKRYQERRTRWESLVAEAWQHFEESDDDSIEQAPLS